MIDNIFVSVESIREKSENTNSHSYSGPIQFHRYQNSLLFGENQYLNEIQF